jgi:hypothetical protein
VKRKGHLTWIIADGFIPPTSSGVLISHESICIVNCNEAEANIVITIYFEDREPLNLESVMVPGQRSKHLRTSLLENKGEAIPVGVSYAMEVSSDMPIVVQYSRQDTTQAQNTLMTSMAFPL